MSEVRYAVVYFITVKVKLNKGTCRTRKNSTSKIREVYLLEERSMCSKFIAIVFSRQLPVWSMACGLLFTILGNNLQRDCQPHLNGKWSPKISCKQILKWNIQHFYCDCRAMNQIIWENCYWRPLFVCIILSWPYLTSVVVFWVVTVCSDVVGYQGFGWSCCHYLQGEVNSTRMGTLI
jgi:hypothetical protein